VSFGKRAFFTKDVRHKKIPPAQGGRRRGEFRIIDFESEE
jgi:hypothetical protein